MKNPDLVKVILGANTDLFFPDVLPWLDLYYQIATHDKSAAVNKEEIDAALSGLYARAVMEFCTEPIAWKRHVSRGALILFPSAWREKFIPVLDAGDAAKVDKAIAIRSL